MTAQTGIRAAAAVRGLDGFGFIRFLCFERRRAGHWDKETHDQ
jgi:hypothetical protein